jgi:hypothetical protein
MKKVNPIIYERLLIQAKEAKDQGLIKLAEGVLNAIGPLPEDEVVSYDISSLNEDVYEGMWKLATHVFKYHDITSANVEKIHETIEALANKFIEDLETSVGVSNSAVGPLEPELPGESK